MTTAPSLIHVVASALSIPPETLNEDSTMENTEGWDSLKQLILVTEVERTYSVRFSFEEMTDEAQSIRDIRRLLAARGVALD